MVYLRPYTGASDMVKRKYCFNQEEIEASQSQGRGQGSGKSYLPWIRAHEINSIGLTTRAPGWKTGRSPHHFLSKLEKQYFYLLEWSEVVYSGSSQPPNGQQADIRPVGVAETSTGSLGDPDKNSKLESVEYGQLQPSSHDGTGGLTLFKEVVKQLAKDNSWSFTIDYYELPSVSRTQFRLLAGQPRSAGLATFFLPDGYTKHLLEVQISDGRYLSTLLLISQKPIIKKVYKDRASLLLWALVKSSGQWKESLLKGLTSKLWPLTVSKIRHLKRLAEKSNEDARKAWSKKIQNTITA